MPHVLWSVSGRLFRNWWCSFTSPHYDRIYISHSVCVSVCVCVSRKMGGCWGVSSIFCRFHSVEPSEEVVREENEKKLSREGMGWSDIVCWYPLAMTNIAIENGHRNSVFTHWKWLFSIVLLVYQRVLYKPAYNLSGWWCGTMEFYDLPLGMSSSQLTFSPWFFRGGGQPATRAESFSRFHKDPIMDLFVGFRLVQLVRHLLVRSLW